MEITSAADSSWAGYYITNETSAVVGGQVSQEDQPPLLGPVPDAFRPLIELQQEVWEAGLAMMKPGLTFGELIDFTNGFGDSRGMSTRILMHGRGIGDDNGPLISGRSNQERIRAIRVEAGNAFVWKPGAHSVDGSLQFT